MSRSVSGPGNVWRFKTVSEAQASWLRRCIKNNMNTAYGKLHGFSDCRTVSDYQASVPMVDYEQVAPWIDRIAKGEGDVLFDGMPVAFEQTSGSTGGAKLIPYSRTSLDDFASAISPWLSAVIQKYAVHTGSAYWSISPVTRGPMTTSAGFPIGLPDVAYIDKQYRTFFIDTLAVPMWVGQLRDIASWKLATVHALICHTDLRLISVWSPTFLLMLLDYMDEDQDRLRAALSSGGIIEGNRIREDRTALVRYERYLESRDPRDLWPSLALVSCWADASSRPYFEQLKVRLKHVHFQPKGLLMTEGVVTVPDSEDRPRLAVESGFFEFIDDAGGVLLAQQLDVGACYEVVMTTAGGLYRYRSGDRVCCIGVSDNGPILQFTGRITLCSDLVGEKLTEAFVSQCLRHLSGFGMLVPDTEKRGYLLVIDAGSEDTSRPELASEIEQLLSHNPQYAYARRVGQLAPLRCAPTPDPLRAYCEYLVARGVGIGDIKTPALRAEPYWIDILEGRV